MNIPNLPDVAYAPNVAYIAPPLTEPAQMLEFFNRMVDVTAGESAGYPPAN